MPTDAPEQISCSNTREMSLTSRLEAFEEILSGIMQDMKSASSLCAEIQTNISAASAAVSNIQRRLSGCAKTAQELSVGLASPEASAEDTNDASQATNLWKRGQDLRQ